MILFNIFLSELSVMGKVKQRSRLSDSYDISGAVEEKNRRNGQWLVFLLISACIISMEYIDDFTQCGTSISDALELPQSLQDCGNSIALEMEVPQA